MKIVFKVRDTGYDIQSDKVNKVVTSSWGYGGQYLNGTPSQAIMTFYSLPLNLDLSFSREELARLRDEINVILSKKNDEDPDAVKFERIP